MPPKRQIKKKTPSPKINSLLAEAHRLATTGHPEAALTRLKKILESHPENPQVLCLMGLALYELGEPEEVAIATLEKAAALAPDDPEVLFNVGLIFQKKDQNARAITHYQNGLRLNPNNASVLSNLGSLLHQEKDFAGALAAHHKAIDLQPSLGGAHANLGETHRAMGQFDAAIQSYLKGLQLCPDLFRIHNNLGALYKAKGELTKAQAAYQKAIDIEPSFAPPYMNMGTTFLEQGKLDAAQEWAQKALTIDPTLTAAWQNALMAGNYSDQLSPEKIYSRHREWGEQLERQTEQERYSHQQAIPQGRRIRIGYVSPDFWQHAVANFIEPILSAHDHSRFEIVCYADTEYPDQLTLRMEQMADQWHDIRELSDQEVAALVVADGIDILVDLTGHTGHNRLAMFALKPAPIQVTYLGYPNTTGLKTMDYRISDNFADPVGMTESLHTETLIRLPRCFLCYNPPAEDLPVNTLPCLTTGHITFGSFNNRPKITDTVIDCWAEILRRTPGSRLVLKSGPLRDAPTRERLLKKFTDLGIVAERLAIVAHVPSFTAHMQLYNTIDIGLDTFPYNGTTTTFEALWMGVPVVSLAGKSHVSRVGVSILSQIGLEECIAKDQEEYIKVATALAQDTGRLQTLRNELRQRLAASPWCDRQNFVRDLETAYLGMVAAWNQKVPSLPSETQKTSPEAQSNLQSALHLNQSGEQLFAKGKLAEAKQAFRKAIELDPQLEVAYNNLGVILWQTGNTPEAIAALQKALQLNPANLTTIDNLSAVLADAGQQADNPAPRTIRKKSMVLYPNSQPDTAPDMVLTTASDQDRERILAEIKKFPFWYHKIKLPGGITTPGWAPINPAAYRIPEDLTGKRVLDVGAWDGYWTFEALRRGAKEVIAIDDFSDYLGQLKESDRKAWATFDFCKKQLGYDDQRCKRFDMSLYDLTEETFGHFDIVFFFGTLYHLRYPLLALDKLAAVCDQKIFVESAILDDFSPYQGGLGHGYPGNQMVMEFYPGTEYGNNDSNWWVPTLHCLVNMVGAAGFKNCQGWKLVDKPSSLPLCRGFASGEKQVAP